jgi:hypothetical protein
MHLVQIQPSVFVVFVDQIFNIRSIELVAFSQARDSVECLADGSPIFCLRARLSLSSQNCFNVGFDGQAFFAGLRRQFVGNVHGYFDSSILSRSQFLRTLLADVLLHSPSGFPFAACPHNASPVQPEPGLLTLKSCAEVKRRATRAGRRL